MHLISDKIYIEDFGDCGGMSRCATCLVQILNQPNFTTQYERNELTTLKRLGYTLPDTRLACQILLNERVNTCFAGIFCQSPYSINEHIR